MNEAAEYREQWPMIGHTDFEDFCRKICEAIATLERAFEAGELSSALRSDRFESLIGPRLYSTYTKLTEATPGLLQNLRAKSIDAMLAQLQNDLVPNQIAQARPRTGKEDNDLVESEEHSSQKFSFRLFDAKLNSHSSVTLRVDQMLDVRFWRIGFSFPQPDFGDAFYREVVRRATTRLASDLLGLQQIIQRFRRKWLAEELKVVPYPSERGFEHLILDVLNEKGRHARIAPLIEDVLEKTDIRVKYEGLERRRGARVQVTSIVRPELHEAKVQRIKLVEEFVFLSPLSLANYVAVLQKQHQADLSSRESFSLMTLWDSIEGKPADVLQLASELKRIMLSALTDVPDSPLGPMARVPLPIRQLIRHFVEKHALASTSRLREREKLHSTSSSSPA